MQVFAYVLFLQMIQNVHSLKYWDPLLSIYCFSYCCVIFWQLLKFLILLLWENITFVSRSKH